MRKSSLIVLSFLLRSILVQAQSDTTFWFAVPDVSSAFNYDRPIFIRITSNQQPCTVTISQPAGGGFPTQTLLVPANSTQSLDLTNWISNLECAPGNVIQNKGLKIVSSNTISAYYEVNANGPNPEIFSLKGRNALGKQFYISSQYLLFNTATHSPIPYSSFNIVASEDNTNITISPTKNIVGHAANIAFTITLNKGQTYAAIATGVNPDEHLQGSFVSSTKPISITLSDDLLKGTQYGGVCEDLAGDQTVPVDIVGTEYIAFKTNLNSPYDKLYITATQNGTTVRQDGNVVTTLNSGQSAELSITTNTTYIQLSAPAYAYQLAGVGCEVGSSILPKLNCTGSSSVSVVRSSIEDFIITLLVKNGGQGNFLLNNNPGVITSPSFTVIPGTGGQWYGAKISLPLGTYSNGSVIRITNTTNLFQMGFLEGGSNSGAGFGYFSDFNTLIANAASPTPAICVGNTIQLFADTVPLAIYNWTGPNSFSSNLQNPLINNAAIINSGNYILSVTVTDCGTYYDTIAINVKPKVFSTINQVICQGQSYFGYTINGTFIDTLIAANGCDSVRTLNLTVKTKAFSTIIQTICQGQSYLGYNSSGTFIDTLLAANGCDSIRTLTLTVKPGSLVTINQTICQGQSYLGYNSSGTYNDTLVAANGCDSIRKLNLTVKPRSLVTINQSICQGQSYLGYSNSGTYIDTFAADNGCDSVRTLNLIVNPKVFSTINQVICQGQNYFGYTTNGTFIDTLIAANGCDSLRTLNLTVKTKAFSTINQNICQGQSYLGYNSSGTFIDTLLAANGCDSIRTLTLTVKARLTTTVNKKICQGQNYFGYTDTGFYVDTLIAVSGCDSIRTLNLEVQNASTPNLGDGLRLCQGDSLIISPGLFDTYLWQDGSTLQSYIVKNPGNYSVTVSNSCSNATVSTFIAGSDCQMYFPNSFTPDNDGKNDIFRILNALNLKDYYLAIYNRWGEKVFETRDYKVGWDGTYKGRPANAGGYIWYCVFKNVNVNKQLKGSLILIR